jgi:hypothetical protein
VKPIKYDIKDAIDIHRAQATADSPAPQEDRARIQNTMRQVYVRCVLNTSLPLDIAIITSSGDNILKGIIIRTAPYAACALCTVLGAVRGEPLLIQTGALFCLIGLWIDERIRSKRA